MKTIRFGIRPLKASPVFGKMIAFGLRIGYWPCMSAPFIQITFLFWRIECWIGKQSNKED